MYLLLYFELILFQLYMTVKLLSLKGKSPKVALPFELELDPYDPFDPEEYGINHVAQNNVVEGIIVSMNNDIVLVSIGYKSEGQISLKEFNAEDKHRLKVGEKLMVYIEKLEDNDGNLVISYEKAKYLEKWNELEGCCNNKEEITGKIVHSFKSGCIVDIDGVNGFLPRSHISLKQVNDINEEVASYVGVDLKFLILKMDKQQGNIVVSRKMVLNAMNADVRQEFIETLEVGQEVIGIVNKISSYGLFVQLVDAGDLALDGLLHITDISWSRISHPSTVYTEGETIRVKIININRETGKISLGAKQMTPNPWANIEEKYPINMRTGGRVISIEEYGIFVELEPGIEGLVHVSELNWIKSNSSVYNFNKGDKVNVMILNIDSTRNRMSLSIKQCTDNPLIEFAKANKLGSKITGVVKSVLDFGIFVEVDSKNKIEGLVKASDVTHDKDIESSLRQYKIGDRIEVKLLHVNSIKCRVILGIKQLSYDPYEEYIAKLTIGDVIMSIVRKIEDDGIYVQVVGFDNVIFFVNYSVFAETESCNIEDKILLKVNAINGYELDMKLQGKIERQ